MNLQHTKRFGFPALRVSNFYIVLFRRWKFGVHFPRSVATKNGISNLIAVNVGRAMLLHESTVDRPRFVASPTPA